MFQTSSNHIIYSYTHTYNIYIYILFFSTKFYKYNIYLKKVYIENIFCFFNTVS